RNMSDDKGKFNLGNFPSTNESLAIVPSKTDNPLNGITAFDALTIFRMATNKSTLASPYEKLAADINGDGIISVLDVLMIQSLLLQKVQKLPGSQWVFINSDMEPVSRIKSNQEYRSKLHFTGVKKGDVNYSASVRSSNRKAGEREQLTLGDPEFHNGFIRVPVNLASSGTVESMQFSLENENETPWIAIESGRIAINPEDYSMDGNSLKVVWIARGEAHALTAGADFYLIFDHMTSNEIDRELIGLSMDLTPEIFDGRELKENTRLFRQDRAGVFEVSNPYPNPFSQEVRFDLTGQTGKLLRTEVYDLSAKRVFYEKIDQEIDQYRLGGSNLPAQGVYT